MIGLIMAGGKGSRMKTEQEKLLLQYKKPVIMHVIDALCESECFEKIIVVTSPNSPKTREFLEEQGISIISSTGSGYVEDLNSVLSNIDDHVFVISGDLPFLDGNIIKQIVASYDPNKTWTSILVSKGFLDSLGLEAEFSVKHQNMECFFAGISLINSHKINSLEFIQETYEILDDKRIAFNLNTKSEYEKLQKN